MGKALHKRKHKVVVMVVISHIQLEICIQLLTVLNVYCTPLALWFHLTISQFRQKIGLFCSTPGIALVRAVPQKVALDMLLTAEPIDAQSG